MLLIAQMTGQLRMQAGLQHPLHQLRQKPALPGQLHPAFINPVHQLIQEPLVEELINRLLRRPLRTVSPRHNVHPVPRFLRSVYTDNLIPPPDRPRSAPTITSGTAPPRCSPRSRSLPGRSPACASRGTDTKSSWCSCATLPAATPTSNCT